MPRIVKLIIFLVVLSLGLIFHLRNDHSVFIDYYLGALELPLSFVVVLVLCTGVILGVLVGLPARIRLKRENARLSRQVSVTENEINALRVIPFKDNP